MQAVQRVCRAGLLGAFLVAISVAGCGEASTGSAPASSEAEGAQSSDSDEASSSDDHSFETALDPAPVQEPDPIDAPAVYGAYCSGCHGAQGEGTAQAYQIQQPVVGYATWVVRHGRPGTPFEVAMPAFGESMMSVGTLDAILAWLREQPRPTDGEGLYLTYCGNCHGPTGRGGIVREGITYDAEDEPDEVLRMVRGGSGGDRYQTRGSFMPAFDEQALTNDEVWLIVDFLRGGDGSSLPEWGDSP